MLWQDRDAELSGTRLRQGERRMFALTILKGGGWETSGSFARGWEKCTGVGATTMGVVVVGKWLDQNGIGGHRR